MVFAEEGIAIIVLGGVLLVVVFLTNSLIGYFFRRRTFRNIQQGYLSQQEIFFMDVNSLGQEILFTEAEYERHMKFQPECDFPVGSGGKESSYPGVHFVSSILESIFTIERSAVAIDPTLTTKPPETAESYIRRLQTRFPKLTDEIISKYAAFYTRALNNQSDSISVTSQEYDDFIRTVLDVTHALKL